MSKSNIDPVLGISLNDEDVLETPPSILIYAPSGAGKSTAVARSFQNLLWLVSSPTVLRPYASWLRDNKEEAEKLGLKMPAMKVIPYYDKDGKTKLDNRDMIRQIIWRYCDSVKAGTCPYKGLVLDEYSSFMARVYENLRADPQFGKNVFGAINEIKTWNSWICSFPRITNHALVLISHEAEPRYEEDENAPTFGKLKYRGGPQCVVGTEIQKMAAEADVVLRIQIKKQGSTVKRSFVTELDPSYVAKFRDFSIKPEEDLDLRSLLQRAGYKL